MLSKFEFCMFSFAQLTTCLMLSTCVTSAPEALAAIDAPPVYANKFKNLGFSLFFKKV